MFKRIFHEDWTTIVPFIAFFLTFAVFVVAIVKSVRMKKDKREHLSSLPLEDDTPEKQ